MSVLKKIENWSLGRRPWEQDALRRIYENKALTERDYAELYEFLKEDYKLSKEKSDVRPRPFPAPQDKSKDLEEGGKITLRGLSKLENINCICKKQKLEFGEGLTVIYGRNGSGKSGYVRLIKQVCRARGKPEEILPNYHRPENERGEAKADFTIKLGEAEDEVRRWRLQNPVSKLEDFSVFDSEAARFHVEKKKDVYWTPYGLDILTTLGQEVYKEMKKKLKEEKDALGEKVTGLKENTQKKFTQFDTKAKQAFEAITSEDSTLKILEKAKLTKEGKDKLASLEKNLKSADPKKALEDSKVKKDRFEGFRDRLDKLFKLVGDKNAVSGFKKKRETWKEAENKKKESWEILKKDFPKRELWEELFQKANAYGEAIHDGEFSYKKEDMECPLCKQTLKEEARARLLSFEDYLKKDAAKNADTAREKFEAKREELKNDVSLDGNDNILSELKNMDLALHGRIEDFLTQSKERKAEMLACLDLNHPWSISESSLEDPSPQMEEAVKKLEGEVEALSIVVNDETEAKRKYSELKDQGVLSEWWSDIQKLHELLKRKENFNEIPLDTTHISNFHKKCVKEAVTEELSKTLKEELGKLDSSIELVPNMRGKAAESYYELCLKIGDKDIQEPPDKILSEGQQRAVAIASFLAETQVARHSNGIIFDDPVSSLDQVYREKVAKRLAAEGEQRQVIVFTHDDYFFTVLRQASSKNKEAKLICLTTKDNSKVTGIISEIPKELKKIEERIGGISQQLEAVEGLNEAKQQSEIKTIYVDMRILLEAIVEQQFLELTIQRYSSKIKIGRIKNMIGFSKKECDEVQELNKEFSDSAHERPLGAPPLKLEDAKACFRRIKKVMETREEEREKALGK